MSYQHKEGEYPFYPTKPEHEVVKPVSFMVISDEETQEERRVIDYSNGAFRWDGILKWGE